jgi:hypothetical protein
VVSLLREIPLRFWDSRMKYALMNYLVNLGLPARIARGVLQSWGEAMGVEITSSDYQMIEQHRITQVVEPRPGQQ